jgi:hypothetical protein
VLRQKKKKAEESGRKQKKASKTTHQQWTIDGKGTVDDMVMTT